MRFLRIRPAVWAMISCSFSSFTLNVALGSSSVTTPGNSSISSFAIRLLPNRSSRENGRANAQNQGRLRVSGGGRKRALGICAGSALPGDGEAGPAACAGEGLAEGDLGHGQQSRVGRGVEEVHPGRDRAPYVLQVVPEGEARSGRDEGGLVVVGEIAPQTADHERLHGGAGPGLHAGADP